MRQLKLKEALGLDFHIFLTLALRGWSVVAGGFTALMIPNFLDPTQQGYYYTFTAVIATQIFFELGFNHVLTQLTSHAAAHLRGGSSTQLKSDAHWRYMIFSLIKISVKWNSIMATLFFVVATSCGSIFFYEKGSLPIDQWLTVWILIAAGTAANLALSAQLAICEGMSEVGQVARLRLLQSVAGYTVLWILLLSGAELWAAVAIPLASAIGTTLWLKRRQLPRSLGVTQHAGRLKFSTYTYHKDIFPLQWRIALSWASGYFIFSFLTPVVFAYQGEVAAGQLGLALTIFSAISAIGMSWISAKIPEFAAHISRKERFALNKLHNRQLVRSVGATALSAALFLISVKVVGSLDPRIYDRLPSMFALLLLAAATVANAIVFSMAAYMRAHKEEPLLANSITSALLIACGVYEMAHVGLTAAVAAYASITVLIVLPWCTIIFSSYRRRIE